MSVKIWCNVSKTGLLKIVKVHQVRKYGLGWAKQLQSRHQAAQYTSQSIERGTSDVNHMASGW